MRKTVHRLKPNDYDVQSFSCLYLFTISECVKFTIFNTLFSHFRFKLSKYFLVFTVCILFMQFVAFPYANSLFVFSHFLHKNSTHHVVLSLDNSVVCVQRQPVLKGNFPYLFLTLLVSKFPFSFILHHFLQNHNTKTQYLVSSSPAWQSSNILQRVQRIKFPLTKFKNLLNSGNASYYLVQNILPSHPLPTNAQMIYFYLLFCMAVTLGL